MKVLVISDSHTHNDFSKHFELHKPDYAVHAGDSQVLDEKELSKYFDKYVKGNCDFIKLPLNEKFSLDTYKIGLTHGHLYEVNYDIDSLLSEFSKEDIIIHGHTHEVRQDILNNKLIINPGSTASSRSSYPTTYMVLNLANNKIKISLYSNKTHDLISEKEVKLNER